MKITEIVSTPELEESLTGDALRGAINLGKRVFGKGSDDAARAAREVPSPPAVPKTDKKTWQQQAQELAAKKQAEQKLARANAKAFQYASEHLSPEVTKALKRMLLLETAIEYYVKVQQLHDKYPGTDEEDEQNPEFIKERLQLRGLMISQWLAPKIANLGLSAVNGAAKVGTLGIYGLIQTAARRVPYAGPLVIDWTKPLVRAAVTAFIVSPAGGKWLAEFLGEHIESIGSMPALMGNVYDWIKGKITGEPDATASDGTADSGAKDDAAGSSTAPSGQAGQPGTGAKPGAAQGKKDEYDPFRLQKVNPYDFSLKDISDKK